MTKYIPSVSKALFTVLKRTAQDMTESDNPEEVSLMLGWKGRADPQRRMRGFCGLVCHTQRASKRRQFAGIQAAEGSAVATAVEMLEECVSGNVSEQTLQRKLEQHLQMVRAHRPAQAPGLLQTQILTALGGPPRCRST